MNISVADTLALGFGLLFIRSAALMIALPTMVGVQVPVRIRVLLALVLAGALMATGTIATAAGRGALPIVLMVGREALVGMAMAVAASIVIGAVFVVGEALGSAMELQTGAILRGAVQVPNPLSDALGTLAGLLFFVAGFHRSLLIALFRSLRVAPLGAASIPGLETIPALGGRLFLIALELALPVMIPLFVLALAQGVISRLAPQINVLITAPAAIVAAGLVLLYLDAFGLAAGVTRAWDSVLSETLGWIGG